MWRQGQKGLARSRNLGLPRTEKSTTISTPGSVEAKPRKLVSKAELLSLESRKAVWSGYRPWDPPANGTDIWSLIFGDNCVSEEVIILGWAGKTCFFVSFFYFISQTVLM